MTTAHELVNAIQEAIANRDAAAQTELSEQVHDFLAQRGYEAKPYRDEHVVLCTQHTRRIVFTNLKDMLEYAESHPNEPTL